MSSRCAWTFRRWDIVLITASRHSTNWTNRRTASSWLYLRRRYFQITSAYTFWICKIEIAFRWSVDAREGKLKTFLENISSGKVSLVITTSIARYFVEWRVRETPSGPYLALRASKKAGQSSKCAWCRMKRPPKQIRESAPVRMRVERSLDDNSRRCLFEHRHISVVFKSNVKNSVIDLSTSDLEHWGSSYSLINRWAREINGRSS